MSSFDDIIQDKANNHEAAVPAATWNNIIKKKKKRRYLFFWWMLGILFCTLTIGGYFVYNGHTKINKPAKAHVANGIKEVDIENDQTVVNGNKERNDVAVIDNVNMVAKNKQVNLAEKGLAIAQKQNKAGKNITGNKTSATSGNNKSKQKISITYGNTDSPAINTTANKSSNDSWAGKTRASKKDKGRTAIKTTMPETGELAMTATGKENNIAVVEDQKEKIEISTLIVNLDKRTPLQQLPVQKSSEQDPIKKKEQTTAQETKKEKPASKKRLAKHPWIIDIAVTPVLPIQQYDHAISFSRTLFLNNNQQVFSGKLVSTGIDPSLTFSIHLRNKISKKLSLGLGLQYVQLKENIHISGIETNTKYNIISTLENTGSGPQLVRDTFITVTQGTREINAVNSYQFLNIPVFLQYSLVQKRSWSLSAVAGIQINIAARYKNEINKDSIAPLISSSSQARKKDIGFSVYGGFRFAKPISKKFEFFFTAFMNWSPTTQNIKNSLINKKIQQAGVSIGVSYKIN